jgi:hypothetical protein
MKNELIEILTFLYDEIKKWNKSLENERDIFRQKFAYGYLCALSKDEQEIIEILDVAQM